VRQISRRQFLGLAAGTGGAVVAAGYGAKSTENLIPYVTPPEHSRPGQVTRIATTCRECPAGCGMHVWHCDGRAIKCEGNPDHPINRGGLCARGQSALQGLYDPDRVRGPMRRPTRGGPVQPVEWKTAIDAVGRRLREGGGRVVVISDLQAGALSAVMGAFSESFGGPPPTFYEPFNYEAVRAAHGRVWGMPVIPDYHIDRCDLLISLGVDFLEAGISPVQDARRLAEMRTLRDGRRGRFVYIGPRLSMTAANADEFLQVPPGAEPAVAAAMLCAMVEKGWAKGDAGVLKSVLAGGPSPGLLPPLPPGGGEGVAGIPAERIVELARAFALAEGSAAMAGPAAARGDGIAVDAAVAVALLNYAAGRVGATVDFTRPHTLSKTATRAILLRQLQDVGESDTVILHQCNPAFSLPGAAEVLGRAGTVVYLGTMMDETAERADWVLPIDSPLESWGDYQPVPLTLNLMQPTMGRIFDTQAAGDIFMDMARAAGRPLVRGEGQEPPADFHAWLREHWNIWLRTKPMPAEVFWQKVLRQGGLWLDSPIEAPEWAPARVALSLPQAVVPETAAPEAALWLWPSVMLSDGRTANRGWLQEAPDPTTHAVWGSWMDIHPSKAKALGIADGDVIALENEAGKVEAPARVTEDVHASTVALAFGQGHTALGRNARGRGANAFALLDPAGSGVFGRVTIRKTGRRRELVLASSGEQHQFGREIVQWVSEETFRGMKPGDGTPLILPLPEGYRTAHDLYPPHQYAEHRWAMVVDLDRCTGCGACAVACYAENNLAVVGEEQVRRGHHMPWLRVVPYRDPDDPRRLGFLPLACQHCDTGPCEAVCPVYASVHNEEGLNAQVYNRCVGTRYCSNNCPYKVRRFNWLNWTWEEPLAWQLNPEVTVRVRGVMEKCTFCIQRIRAGEHRAKREDRKVRDGEIQPACVQSCPTRAYVFGDLLDPEAEVTRLTRLDPRRYHVLEELNTKPAVTFLRRVRRP
jgi:anaerobic selenocysteine-containing dehydrogenase/Fe-S-cluster-containing dehydrogenase component